MIRFVFVFFVFGTFSPLPPCSIATVAGNWPTNARPVLEKVNQSFVIFYVLYITIIVFAVIRVISATFLKDTLDAAQNDAENLVVERLRKKAQYVKKLEEVFMAIDQSGDGMCPWQQHLPPAHAQFFFFFVLCKCVDM